MHNIQNVPKYPIPCTTQIFYEKVIYIQFDYNIILKTVYNIQQIMYQQ